MLTKVATFLGLQFVRGRAWVTIGALVAIAFGGAFTMGYMKASLNCAAANAKAEIKSERVFSDSVKDASDMMINSAVQRAYRNEFFRDIQTEIEEKYGEKVIVTSGDGTSPCGDFFDDDDLRLFNSGNIAKDSKSIRSRFFD